MVCQHLEDIYELYLLGALEGDECTVVQEHLARNCPYCFERLREAALTIYLSTLLAPPSRPGSKTRTQFLNRLRKDR